LHQVWQQPGIYSQAGITKSNSKGKLVVKSEATVNLKRTIQGDLSFRELCNWEHGADLNGKSL
jgi:hypothetical protein